MRQIKKALRTILIAAAAGSALLGSASAAAEEKLRIAFIDPLSGAFANVGDFGVKHWQYLAEHFNAQGGIAGRKIEIVPFDNKASPQESLLALRQIVDQGIRYIAQGNGSHVAGALIQAVEKHNQRNPDRSILYINFAAQDNSLFNELCSYWHVGLDPSLDMRVRSIVRYIAERPDIKKVFLINQDYAYGQGWSRQARKMLAEMAPSVEVVGDILHPIGKVKDFSQYALQIKQSGAQAVLTGNWGNDLTLLIRAGADVGVDAMYFTQAAGGLGAPSSIGKAGDGKVFVSSPYYRDLPDEGGAPQWFQDFVKTFEQRYAAEQYYWYYMSIVSFMQMIKQAAEQVDSIDPAKLMPLLEDKPFQTLFGEARLRKSDHQFLQPMFLSKLSSKAKNEVEKSGMGYVGERALTASESAVATHCNMKRPN